MKRQNLVSLEKTVEKKCARRDRKKRPRLKVSGAGVKKLQKIIADRCL